MPGFLSGLFARPQARITESILRDHQVAGRVLPLTIQPSSRASRLTLRIDPSGKALKVTVPHGAGLGEVEKFLARHEGWLQAKLKTYPDRPDVRAGIRVPVRGVPHAIVHAPGLRGATAARTGPDGPELLVHGDEAHLPRRVADFLKKTAKDEIAPLVARHTATVRRKAMSVSYKDTKSRWGSCSADGNLSFSWRIAMAPPVVIDYLVAHEVAHLVEMNHSPRFWKLCRQLCPRTDEAKAWLKRNGAKLQAIGFD
ncbi:MAG TPA: SprT family zinc-dependent metalloprotease [Rhizobiaceae bacterium]|nr:SprT family zinc-dependent metalloprotease [Rhizobiaceae bacterium]